MVAQMKTFSSTVAAFASALLLASCATKKDTTPRENTDDTPAMTAHFVDGSAPSKKKPLLADTWSFFSNLLPRKAPPTPTASPVQWAGEIRMVNIAENFVLVESITAVATVPGEKYLAVQNGRETGVVRMTSLRNPPFLIADIVSGDPSPGDKIHLPQPTVSAQSMENAPSKKPGLFLKWLHEILPTSKPKE
jgi:hypothetical protein